jgi:NADH-quinone oxidoreductase subunit L
MWVPYAILVIIMIGVGILGVLGLFIPSLSPELFIEHHLSHMVEHIFEHMHLTHMPHFEAHVEVGTKLTAVGLSAGMLILGGISGWFVYLARKVNPKEVLDKSPFLKRVHTFLWNRWYMNPAYYRVFVDGTLKLKQVIFDNFELKVIDRIDEVVSRVFMAFSRVLFKFLEIGGIDEYLNHRVPAAFTNIYNKIKKTQTGVLSYNMLYVIIILLILLVGMLIGGR